jgi:Na+/proline symporter
LSDLTIQWILVIASSLILFFVSPYAKTVNDFFKGSKLEKEPGFILLTSSLVISWLFAKSITNSANLGLSYGIVGGVAYAGYYLSFLVAGITIYYMRVKGKFNSIHEFLSHQFGRSAIFVFSLLISFRLLNEVWSNTMVIGSYFGEQGTSGYFLSIVVFTGLTLAYTLKGGLRSSLLTDMIQMVLFIILLFVILTLILPKEGMSVSRFLSTGEWTAAGGINLIFVALIQVFSYPFHDPVMTDRAFIAPPKLTLKSFIVASLIGSTSIILFSFIGIYGSFIGVEGQAAVGVSQMMGVTMMIMINFIMITSAASTLDSAFNSFSKMMVIDIKIFKDVTISKGRLVIIAGCLIGTFPIFFNPSILSATTVSGTMVIGLTPVFLFWYLKAPTISFHLSILAGIASGILLMMEYDFPFLHFDGPYHILLEANIVGFISCVTLYLIPVAFTRWKKSLFQSS